MQQRNLAIHKLFLALALAAGCSSGGGSGVDRQDQDLNPGDSTGGDDALCAAVTCEAGSTCTVITPQCITEPCDPMAVCVPGGEPPTSPCDAVRCKDGYHCEERLIQCVTEPCENLTECVPDEPPSEGASCAATLCLEGTYCDDSDGSAECIPLPRN